jgi:hypothetical protein
MFNKGIVFIGCSYTWGSGLQYYSGYNQLETLDPNTYDGNKINHAMYKFICANRYARLAANKLNGWEIVKTENGGSEDSSIQFLREIFKNSNYSNHTSRYTDKEQYYNYDEVKYVILQLTDPFRNPTIDLNGKELHVNIATTRLRYNQSHLNDISLFKNNLDEATFDEFFEFYTKNFNSWEEMENYFIQKNLDKIQSCFEDLESKGIKCYIHTWQTEYISFLKNSNYFNKKWIKYNYDGKKFDSVRQLQEYNNGMFFITNDKIVVNGKEIYDDHQNLECHKIMADNIANFILNDINAV